MERTSCQGLLVRLKGEKLSHTSVQLVWGTGGPVDLRYEGKRENVKIVHVNKTVDI